VKRLDLSVLDADRGERLDRFISRAGAISRGLARRTIEAGGVFVDGKRVKIASKGVYPGQRVAVALEEPGRAAQSKTAASAPLSILFDDAALLAVAKPAFVAAQATLAGDEGTLTAQVAEHLGLARASDVGLVHRLDRETSGVTLFGKTKTSTAKLAEAFREGRVRKRYLAIATGPLPAEGTIDAWLAKDPSRPGQFKPAPEGTGVPALTRFRALAREEHAAAVELFPETGRTHQLRVHLRSLNAPILGDVRYGAPRELTVRGVELRAERVLLHAESVRLAHPVSGAELVIRAAPPADLQAALDSFAIPGGAR
jgi:23S rRNA pseudouridine1911/1915/1917 synthase